LFYLFRRSRYDAAVSKYVSKTIFLEIASTPKASNALHTLLL